MTGKKTAGKRIAIQARLTEADHALMIANMHRAGFGLVSEYLTYLATSSVPQQIGDLERRIGKIGNRTNMLLRKLLAAGAPHQDVAAIIAMLSEIQTELSKEISGS